MSRRTPVKELQSEDVAEGSLRRSSRLAYNSPAPVKIPQRRNSGSSNDVPAKITKTKRLSLSQESSVDSADNKILQEMATVGTPKRTRSTRSASKSPTALAKETNTKAASVKTRGRRGSQSKSIDEEKIDSTAPPSSRLRSTRSESKSPISVKDVEPAKPRTRRGSITEKVNQLEKIEETEPTATEPKKRYKGRKSSVSEMSQLDVIEETEVNKTDTAKQDLESIKEATETDEKGKASTSSEREYTEKTEKDGKDKFKLSPIVRIEKSKTIADLTALPERSDMDKPGTDLTAKKAEDDTQPGSEPAKDKLDLATVQEASSSGKIQEEENIPLVITNETNILESNGAKSSLTLINEEEMGTVSENNTPQNIEESNPDEVLEKSTKVEDKTLLSDTQEETEVISKKNVDVTSTHDHVDAKNMASNNEIERMDTSDLNSEATTKLAIEDEIIVKDIDKLLGTAKPENTIDSDLSISVKTKEESRDQPIDVSTKIKDPGLNVSDTVDIDVDVEKLEVENDLSVTDKSTDNTNLTTPTKTKDFANENLTNEVSSTPSDESFKKERSYTTVNDETKELIADEDKDGKLTISSSEEVAIDNANKADDKSISKATTLLKDCNRSLSNLIPEQLDMSLGSDGSFRMNLSLQNIESCSSKEDLTEESKDKHGTDVLNTSGSSDKENQENNELLQQLQQNSPKAGNLNEIKVPVTNISSNEINQTPKDTRLFEPMEVDDASPSFVETTPNNEKRSLDNGAKCAITYTIARESTDSHNVSVETVKEIVSCKDIIDTEQSDKTEISKDTSTDDNEISESQGTKEITPSSVDTVEVDISTDKVTTELNMNENNLKSINEMDATSKCNEIEKNIDESKENQENLPDIEESINISISENRENNEREYTSPVFSITNTDISDEEQNVSPVQMKPTIGTKENLTKTHENNGQTIQEEESAAKEGIDNISTIISDSPNILDTKETAEIVIEEGKEVTSTSKTLEENSVIDVKCTLSKSLNSSDSINEEEVDRSEILTTEGKSINSDITTSQPADENGVVVENITTEYKTSIAKSPEKKRISLKKADSSNEISELKSTCSIKEDTDIEFPEEIHIPSEVIKAKRNSNNKAGHRSPKGKDKKAKRQSEEITAQILADVQDQVVETSKKLKTSDVYNIETEIKASRRKSALEKHAGEKKKSTPPTKKDMKHKKFSPNDESVLEKATELDEDHTMVISSNSEDEQDASEFIDDMAEEGEEDTPSEGSNDIICEGESINSYDTYTEDDDDSYGDDSFIDDEDEKHELLSGEENFLQSNLPEEIKPHKSRKSNDKTKTSKKHKRIITPSESEDDQQEVITEKKAEQVNEGNEETAEVISELKSSGIENETVNKRPVEELTPQDAENSANIPVDLMPARNDVIHVDSDSDSESPSVKEGQKNQNELNSSSSTFDKKSKRKSSISIQENIKLEDIQDGELSERISKVVDWFYSGIKGSSDAGNISLNVSLDYADQSPNEETIVIDDGIVMKSEDILKKSMKRIDNQTVGTKSLEEDVCDQLVDSVFITDSEENIKPSKQGKKLKRKSLQKQQKDTEAEGEIDVSEKIATVKKINKRHSQESQIQTDDNLDEAVGKGAKRLSGEKLQHISPKRSKVETDFVIENIPPEKPKKKKAKKDQHGDSTTKESIEDLEIDYSKNKSRKLKKSPTKEDSMGAGSPKTKITNTYVDSKNKRKTKPASGLLIDESNLISRDTKGQKRRKISVSDEESSTPNLRYTSLKKAKKSSASNIQREITDEFEVEIESINANKNKKNSYKKKKTDHIPCSSGIIRQHITSKTSASKREVDGFPQKEGKVKRKISQKLLPTKTMDLGDSWESEIFNVSLHPSVSNKKILEAGASKKKKTDVDSFNSKDFKNRMLYDSNRVKRMDTKALLKQRKKF